MRFCSHGKEVVLEQILHEVETDIEVTVSRQYLKIRFVEVRNAFVRVPFDRRRFLIELLYLGLHLHGVDIQFAQACNMIKSALAKSRRVAGKMCKVAASGENVRILLHLLWSKRTMETLRQSVSIWRRIPMTVETT